MAPVLVNVVHGMVSTCQSANSALILVRLLCVPPWAVPPGTLAAAKTVTFALAESAAWLVVLPMPWKATVPPDVCAGANMMKTVGFEILVVDIPMTPGVPLIP